MTEQVEIDENMWQIILGEDKQISFSYAIPKRLSTWRNHPLWRNWDPSDTSDLDEEWSYDFEHIPTLASPFRIKSTLIAAVALLIRRSNTNFFYFTPSSHQRGRIYSNLTRSLISALGGNWRCQLIEEYWFYFFKDDAGSN